MEPFGAPPPPPPTVPKKRGRPPKDKSAAGAPPGEGLGGAGRGTSKPRGRGAGAGYKSQRIDPLTGPAPSAAGGADGSGGPVIRGTGRGRPRGRGRGRGAALAAAAAAAGAAAAGGPGGAAGMIPGMIPGQSSSTSGVVPTGVMVAATASHSLPPSLLGASDILDPMNTILPPTALMTAPVMAAPAPVMEPIPEEFAGVMLELEAGPQNQQDDSGDEGGNAGGGGGGGGEDSDDEDADDVVDEIVIQPTSEEERIAMKALIDTFTEDKIQRFEVFRRSKLPKNIIKKVLQPILGYAPTASICIAVAGSGKLFVGQMVELGMQVMEERGETGPLRPEHLREAFYRYQKRHSLNSKKIKLR